MVSWILKCVLCRREYPGDADHPRCSCGETLEVIHDFSRVHARTLLERFDQRLGSKAPLDRSGVWRFRELILPGMDAQMVTRREGNTGLYPAPSVARYVGLESLLLKHEGENPTGSFKDRGMTCGMTMAVARGMKRVACASTGNTSASMAAYAAQAGLRAHVFIPDGAIAFGKLAQALAYGAQTLQISGDFDAAMSLVEQVCATEGIYLLNSVNPFRIEGQKAILFELLQDLDWKVPDWIVVPGGNLGNSSALYKGLSELLELGLIERLPRLAIVQAEGAAPLYHAVRHGGVLIPQKAETLASAIRIGAPVSWRKALRALDATHGVVEAVSDQAILDAKAQVDAAGIGAEPASCATVAGIKSLITRGIIQDTERVVGILTGNLLKDSEVVIGYHRGSLAGFSFPFANAPVRCDATLEAVRAQLGP